MKNLYILGGIAVLVIVLIWASASYMNKGPSNQQQTATTTTATGTPTKASSTAVPAKTTTTTTKVTTTTTKPSAGTAPKISSFAPSAATVGSTVTIIGTGFSTTKNYVLFGTSSDRTHTDGSPDNSISTAGSPDGKTLSFTVPASGPSGLLCDSNGHCIGVSAMRIVPGTYPISVRNQNGTSATQLFTVVGS